MGNSPFIRVLHEIRLLRVPRSAAVRARDLHVWQELDIQADLPGTIADRAAQFSRILGKIACLALMLLRLRHSGINFSQFIMHICISSYR